VVLVVYVAPKHEESNRKWHRPHRSTDQEELCLEFLSLPECKLIGGEGHGVSEGKVDTQWSTLQASFCENVQLVAGRRKTAGGLGLMSKFKSLQEIYTLLKQQCKVDHHQLRGGYARFFYSVTLPLNR
jgi:hypothetical protein